MEENKIFISLGVLAAVGYGYYAWAEGFVYK
mgnify:CR=1 FL=1